MIYVELLHEFLLHHQSGGPPPFCRSWPMKRLRQWWAGPRISCHRKMLWLWWLYYSGYPTWYLGYIDVGLIISYLIHGDGVRNPVREPVWVSVGLYHIWRALLTCFLLVWMSVIRVFPQIIKLLFVFLMGKPMRKRMDTSILSKVHIVNICHVM